MKLSKKQKFLASRL